MIHKVLSRLTLLLFALVAGSFSAQAAPIEVGNHSFEIPALGAGGWSNDLPVSTGADDIQWAERAEAVAADRFIEYIGGFFSEGNQHIGVANGHYLFQNLGIPYEPNTKYTLTVGVGYRNPTQSGPESYTVIGLTALGDGELMSAMETEAQLAVDPLLESTHTRVESVSLNNSVEMSFTDVTVEYSTDDAVPEGNVVIFLGDDIAGVRSHFDNIRLDAVTTLDPDGDKIPAEWETGTDRGVERGLDPTADDGGEDPDGDTLTNFEEFELGTHPRLADTDGDGLNDNFESSTDPLNPDVDGDTLSDGDEIANYGTDPNDADSDGDDFEDQAEIAAGTDPLSADSKPSLGGAILLGANFVGGGADSDGAEVTGEAGAVSQSNWNNFPGGFGAPVIANNAQGEPSLLRVSWATNGPGIAGDPGGGNQQLMHGILLPRGDGAGGDDVITEITVKNIAYPLFDLYVYFNSTDGGPAVFEANDEVVNVADVIPFDGNFVEVAGDGGSGNYVKFENLSGSTLTILGRSLGVAGFQIERVKPADPSLLAIPNAVDFGVFDGNPGPQQATIRVINPGETQTLNFTETTITGDQAANFSVSGLPVSLGPNEGVDVTVTFDPTEMVGIYRGVVEISSNDAVSGLSKLPLVGQIKHANGLVAHYKMDETEGDVLTDASGNGFHGTYVAGSGSVNLGEPSLIDGTGGAVRFEEGSDAAYAEIPADIGFPTLGEGSYACWIQQDAADVGTPSVIFSRSSSPANPFAVVIEEVTSDPDVVRWVSQASVPTLDSEPFLIPNQVFHVVYTYSDSNGDGNADVAVYVDGELNASADGASGYPLDTIAPFLIGSTAGAFGWTGSFGDFQVYERALSAEDAKYLYDNPGETAPAPPTPDFLVGYWPLDEGEGDVAADYKNPALNGTVMEGTWGGGHSGAAGDSAVELSGVDGGTSVIEIPALNTTFTEITITGWIKGQPTGDWTGIIQSRDGAQPIGLGVRAGSGELAYTWNDNNGNTYNFVSGLAIPADEWTFIALRVTPEEGKLYLGVAGGELQSAVNAIPHLEQESPTVWHLGKDNCCGTTRNFSGAIDDVAIFEVALEDDLVQSIFEGTSPPDVFGGEPRADAVAQSAYALAESTVVDFGDLSGDATYEFGFNAVKGDASTAIAGNDAWGLKLDQWNEQGVFGLTEFGVADIIFDGVPSVFDERVHVVFVSDTTAGETRLYINGVLAGTAAGTTLDITGQSRVMGARIATPVDFMGDGSVMYGWATYNTALGADAIAALSTTAFKGEDTIFEPNAGSIGGISHSGDGVGIELPAGTFDIEYSLDLENWDVIASDVNESFTDDDATRINRDIGFYRGVLKQ